MQITHMGITDTLLQLTEKEKITNTRSIIKDKYFPIYHSMVDSLIPEMWLLKKDLKYGNNKNLHQNANTKGIFQNE